MIPDGFLMYHGILVPIEHKTASKAEVAVREKLCVLCQRPVDVPEFFNSDWPWPTCGHGRFPRHRECMTALDHAFQLASREPPSEWRSIAFNCASCPICNCGEEYT